MFSSTFIYSILVCRWRLLCINIILLLQITNSIQQAALLCGVPQINQTELIIKGRDTFPGEWPWHAAIYHWQDYSDSYVCGGTLITETFVLTAAHCVLKKNTVHPLSTKSVFVRLGVHNLRELHPYVQQHSVNAIHVPANYAPNRFTKDIALIELKTVVQLNEYVQPACLNRKEDLKWELGWAIGWGFTDNYEVSSGLKSVVMPVVSVIQCLASNRNFFGKTLNDDVFCAGYTNGTSVCNGDSGGGLFFKQGNAWFLGGIVSFSQIKPNTNFCNVDGYGAFTKVVNYVSWIQELTKFHHHTDNSVTHIDNQREGNYERHFPQRCGFVSKEQRNSSMFQWPWIAQVVEKTKGQKDTFCSGSLVHERFVLTAATCAAKKPYRIIIGMHDCQTTYNECRPLVFQYPVESVIIHENFNKRNLRNNIALIRLSKVVVFEEHIQPVCLPVTPTLRQAQLANYSTSVFSEGSYHQNATLQEVDRFECFHVNSSLLQYSQLCITGGGFLKGNNGAPMGFVDYYGTSTAGMRFVLFGVTSHRVGMMESNKSSLVVYTRVASYVRWIVENIST